VIVLSARFRRGIRGSAARGEQTLEGLDARAQTLLAYLLLRRERPHSREMLVETLWEDANAHHARKQLRQALWQLHAALDSHAHDGRILLVDSDWISINAEADIVSDVALFEEAFQLTRGSPGSRLDDCSAVGDR